jgi:hypothetical protein
MRSNFTPLPTKRVLFGMQILFIFQLRDDFYKVAVTVTAHPAA